MQLQYTKKPLATCLKVMWKSKRDVESYVESPKGMRICTLTLIVLGLSFVALVYYKKGLPPKLPSKNCGVRLGRVSHLVSQLGCL